MFYKENFLFYKMFIALFTRILRVVILAEYLTLKFKKEEVKFGLGKNVVQFFEVEG